MQSRKKTGSSPEIRKRAVSIRMSASDVSKIKRLAERLGVRDSDVIRFAVKSALAKLAPLDDPSVRGRNLVPVFVESGSELLRFFELDAMRLENIINDEAEEGRRVDHDDIQLIAMSGMQPPYVRWRLTRTPVSGTVREMTGRPNGGSGAGFGDSRTERDIETTPSLRDYLFAKYVNQSLGEA